MIKSKVRTKEGTEDITAYSFNEVDFSDLKFSKRRRNKRIYLYADEYAVLDTETSHDSTERAWIYQWAFMIGYTYVYGRKPSEFIALLHKLRDRYELNDMKKIIIYVHNLSYDLQYLKHYLKEYDENIEIFATDSHTMLIVDVFGFRFLCSYKLSNMSLDLFSRSYAEKYLKAVGEIDYTKIRYQDTDLTDDDWFYMFSDVASQHDAIRNYLQVNGFKKAFMAPYTSTGFVRTDSRKASEKEPGYRRRFARMALRLDQYKLLQQAFQGGLTIASFLYAGQTVTNDAGRILHKDFNSSYPARQMMDYFPIGKPFWYGEIESRKELEFLLNKYCCCFVLHIENLRIRPGVTAPCIPASKCIYLSGDLRMNGKLVYADEMHIAVTEIDYKWIRKQYTGENMKITNMLCMKRGAAPDWLKGRIMKYYHNKCTLKKSDPRLYQCSKGLLNGIYGMSATRICRDSYAADPDMILQPKKEDEQKQLSKYYRSFNSFMPYQFGVWTTAHARDALLTMIEAAGYENFLYCDTDSIFYISTPDGEKRLAAMNAAIKERAIKAGAYDGDNVLGLAADEPEIKRFRALHAKCYAMEEMTPDGGVDFKVTIAGIPKRTTKYIDGEKVTISNAEELGDIDRLQDGFVFRHNGGTRSIYIEDIPRTEIINGHKTELASACIIENIEKEINDTMYSRSGFIPMHIKQTSS